MAVESFEGSPFKSPPLEKGGNTGRGLPVFIVVN